MQLDDGLGGNVGLYAYPGEPARRASKPRATSKPSGIQLPSPKPTYDPPPPSLSGDPWYEQWWVWTLVGAAIAGGTTTAVVLSIDTTPTEFGGTVRW